MTASLVFKQHYFVNFESDIITWEIQISKFEPTKLNIFCTNHFDQYNTISADTLWSFHKWSFNSGNKPHGISINILETKSLSYTNLLMFMEEYMTTSQCFTTFITLADGTTNRPSFCMINKALVHSEADLTSADEDSLRKTYLVTFRITHTAMYSTMPSTKASICTTMYMITQCCLKCKNWFHFICAGYI